MMLIVCVNKAPVISPCDKAFENIMAVFTPPYEYVDPSELESGEAPSHWRATDKDTKKKCQDYEDAIGPT
jgi:hypothetical protein